MEQAARSRANTVSGLDKRELLPLVFSEADMNAMLSVRAAFDPLGLCNPGKIVPLLRGCGEAKAVAAMPETDRAWQRHSTSNTSDQRQRTRQCKVIEFDPASAAPLVAQIVGDVEHRRTPVIAQRLPNVHRTDRRTHETRIARTAGVFCQLVARRGPTHKQANLIVNTRRLDQIIEHEPADLIAIAQAGVKLADFNAKLARERTMAATRSA